MKKILLTISVCIPFLIQAQSWELGGSLGAANYQGDLVEPSLFTLKETNLAGGLLVKRNIDDHWAIRLNGMAASLSGDDNNYFKNIDRKNRDFSFKTSLFEVSGLVEVTFNKVFNAEGELIKARPYLFGGLGYTYTNPKVDWGSKADLFETEIAKDKANLKKSAISFPVGAGMHFPLDENQIISAEIGFRPIQSDYLDGISNAGNSLRADWYVIGGLQYSYRFGSQKDSDGDGVNDRKDKCPEIPGVESNNGCPSDVDNDGVYDRDDRCPTVAGTVANMGCPEMAQEDKYSLALAVQQINFETSSATLTPESFVVLDTVATILTRYNYYSVNIEGHTDDIGEDLDNLRLSGARAKACIDYLLQKGIAPSRLHSEGFGESKPLLPNTSEENRRKNRRVEFKLVVKKN